MLLRDGSEICKGSAYLNIWTDAKELIARFYIPPLPGGMVRVRSITRAFILGFYGVDLGAKNDEVVQ